MISGLNLLKSFTLFFVALEASIKQGSQVLASVLSGVGAEFTEYRFQIFMVTSSIGLLILVWQLIRRGQFRPAYALLWLLACAVFFFISLFRGLVQALANFFQVDYPPSFMFALGIIFILVLLINQTAVLSFFARKNKEIAQNYALLQWRLERLEEQLKSTAWSPQQDNAFETGFKSVTEENMASLSETLTSSPVSLPQMPELVGGNGNDNGDGWGEVPTT
jgi:hypothetical protein